MIKDHTKDIIRVMIKNLLLVYMNDTNIFDQYLTRRWRKFQR